MGLAPGKKPANTQKKATKKQHAKKEDVAVHEGAGWDGDQSAVDVHADVHVETVQAEAMESGAAAGGAGAATRMQTRQRAHSNDKGSNPRADKVSPSHALTAKKESGPASRSCAKNAQEAPGQGNGARAEAKRALALEPSIPAAGSSAKRRKP